MSVMRPFIVRLALALWAIFTIFAPPGLPACWLEKVPCEFHTHFSEEQAETPHTHYYLIDLTEGTAVQPQPLVHLDAALLVIALSMSGAKIWQKNSRFAFERCEWALIPEPPPPRLTASS